MSSSSLRKQSYKEGTLHAANWPIAAGLLQFPATTRSGRDVRALGPLEWKRSLDEVAQVGFDHVELTDGWLKPGDLSLPELAGLRDAAEAAGLAIPSVALIRRSVLDVTDGQGNLAYSHRSIDAAAELGASVVSVGLHEPLSAEQRRALWFWTRRGGFNEPADADLWTRAVVYLRELGTHAESLGLLLSLEMYEDTYLGTADSAVRLVTDVDLAGVGLNSDTGNLVRMHRAIEPPQEVLAKVLPYTNYWHVKNYLRLEDDVSGLVMTAPTFMEIGVINYRDAVALALDAGFSGVITCEHYGGDGISVSATNRDYIRRLLPARNGDRER